MPRVLRNLKINEVSGVDQGAGRGVKVLLMKRADGTQEPTDMTIEEINKAIADAVGKASDDLKAEIAKRDDEIALLKMTDSHKSFHDSLDSDEKKKKFRDASPEDRDGMIERAKPVNAKTEKRDAEFDKRFDDLQKRNGELEKMVGSLLGDRRAQEFTKHATETGLRAEDGEIMRKAYDGDPEAQIAFQKRVKETIDALKSQVKTSVVFGEFGKANTGEGATVLQQIEAKAAELRKVEPKLTKEQAFTKVYTDPANAELVAQDKHEQAARLTRIAAGTQ